MILSSWKGKSFNQLMNCKLIRHITERKKTSKKYMTYDAKFWHMTAKFSTILLKGWFFTQTRSLVSSRMSSKYCEFWLIIFYASYGKRMEDFYLETWLFPSGRTWCCLQHCPHQYTFQLLQILCILAALCHLCYDHKPQVTYDLFSYVVCRLKTSNHSSLRDLETKIWIFKPRFCMWISLCVN